jgi:hypothetical protein
MSKALRRDETLEAGGNDAVLGARSKEIGFESSCRGGQRINPLRETFTQGIDSLVFGN